MKLLALSGQAAAGKDTVADYLVSEYGFIKIAQADPIKRICRDVYKFSDAQLWGPSELRNAPDIRYLRETHARHYWINASDSHPWTCETCGINETEAERRELVGGDECRVYLSPRHALQILGTQWGRDCYPATWIDLALSTARDLIAAGGTLDYTGSKGVFSPSRPRSLAGIVITDCRFRNEVDAFSAEGEVWRITRPDTNSLSSAAASHSSEMEQKSIPLNLYKEVILNGSTLADLYSRIDVLMKARTT